MHILQLTKKFPYPPKDGESILISDFNTALKNNQVNIDLLSFNTVKHFFDINKYPPGKNPYNRIETVFLDNRIKPVAAIKNLFSKEPFHISRFIDETYKSKLKRMLLSNAYDVILMESIFLAPYLPVIKANSGAKIIMRAHNVEYEIWERIIKNTTNLPLRLYLNYLTKKLKKYELNHINDFDMVITLTDRDMEKYVKNGLKTKGLVLPAGIDASKFENIDKKLNGKPHVAFIGSLDWTPNIEGINWFIKKIWRKVIKKYPDAVLHIAGRNTPASMYKMNSANIKVHGEVPDAIRFLEAFDIVIVPLLSGGGMRLKILEAMAMGKIIITTGIGVEGIEAKDMQDVLIANTPKEFENKLAYCFDNPHALSSISQNAIKLFHSKYNLNQTTDKFIQALTSLLQSS